MHQGTIPTHHFSSFQIMQTTINAWNSTFPAAATLLVDSEQSTLNSLSLFLRDRMRWSCFVWKTKSLHQQQEKGWAELSNYGKGSFISSWEFSHVNSTLGFLEYWLQGSFTILIQQITGEKGPQTHYGLAINQCVPDFWAFELQHTAIFLFCMCLHWTFSAVSKWLLKRPSHLIKN